MLGSLLWKPLLAACESNLPPLPPDIGNAAEAAALPAFTYKYSVACGGLS